MTPTRSDAGLLSAEDAATYADWFACLADPTRVRLLHAVAGASAPMTIGELTERMGFSQSTCSHHVRKLADVGFVLLRKAGTATLVSANASCWSAFPHAADVVMGVLAPRPPHPTGVSDEVAVRPLKARDWPAVRRIYRQGIATGDATLEPAVPDRATLEARWLPDYRWVAERDGTVVGWTAAAPVSTLDCCAGVVETPVYVAEGYRGQGVGRALLHQLVTTADERGLWTLQTSLLPENRASFGLYRAAGYRTVGVRERIAEHHGRWRDLVLLERRRTAAV